MKRVSVIVVAAGEGKRFGGAKPYVLLKGKPILEWALDAFEAHEDVAEVILVLRDDSRKKVYSGRYTKIVSVVKGGEKRQDSVLSGFRQIDPTKVEKVLVHDGVRPLVSSELIGRIIEAVQEKEAVVPAVPLKDTVKRVDEQEVKQTLEREKLFCVQTPQGFFYSVLKAAFDKAGEENFYGTDEAALVERIGKKVYVVQGDPKNIKITTPEDIKIAEALIED
jgi:2-C-methyl-D-erythritol 4-phosphate cytidylyltransferase